MRHSVRIVAALAGTGLIVTSVSNTRSAQADMVAPVPPSPAGPNPRSCPARKPAYGAPCAPALRDVVCTYPAARSGSERVSYRCAASGGSSVLWWQLAARPMRYTLPVPGPLPPPELSA